MNACKRRHDAVGAGPRACPCLGAPTGCHRVAPGVNPGSRGPRQDKQRTGGKTQGRAATGGRPYKDDTVGAGPVPALSSQTLSLLYRPSPTTDD